MFHHVDHILVGIHTISINLVCPVSLAGQDGRHMSRIATGVPYAKRLSIFDISRRWRKQDTETAIA